MRKPLAVLTVTVFSATLLAPASAVARPTATPATGVTAVARQLPVMPRLGMVCTDGTLAGTTRTFQLTASSGQLETPDGNSLLAWSYGVTGGHFQSPGPVLCANAGETVSVHLHNALSEPVSIVVPGQEGVVATGAAGLLTSEAPAGGDATYTFPATHPGTYVYESGSNPAKQLEMGLYGALVVRPAGHPNWAYDSAATAFDPQREYLLVLSEFDPDLHHAVEVGATYDFNALHNRYFAINGREFPDTIQDNGVSWLPNQPYGALVRVKPYDVTSNPLPALIRMVNVGELNHPFHPHGNHIRRIAQDGRPFASPGGLDASSEHFGDTIAVGQTEDFLFTWTDQDSWSPGSNPLPPLPSYRDLTFKDGNTWFSGSPYLGAKGPLPSGVTSQNLCGEWYFPWHSHALNEFTNFDQGFGGMATLLRVDPLGGCAALPAATKILAGTLGSGGHTYLGAADTLDYRVNSTTTGTRTADWYAGFTGVPSGATGLSVTYTGRNCGTGAGSCPATAAVPTTLWAWRWATSAWVQLGPATAVGTSDVTVAAALPAPLPDFIGTGANQGQVRVRVQAVGGATNFVTNGNLLRITYDAP